MIKTLIKTAGYEIPGIPQAVVASEGKLLFLSGHVPYSDQGVLAEGVEAQLEQVFSNISRTLTSAGATEENLVRLSIYICDLTEDLLPMIRQQRDKFLNGQTSPATSLIGVASLFQPGVLVEVDGIAVLPCD